MKIPRCLLPLTIDSNDDTLTELFIHQSDNGFAAITAYSLSQIDVSHSFVLSFQIAIYQNEPQAVEQPIQNLTSSLIYCGIQFTSAPHSIVRAQSVYEFSNLLKFTLALAPVFQSNSSSGGPVPEPFPPIGALVYLYPSFVTQLIDIAQYEDIYLECQTQANFYITPLAVKLILV
ncbi:MAG: hypothetical protein EZS28_004884 [Streblomastix strix]|uniref:Uncharacterized protein n=1 Tax=Streblomastix strix TaxID=222440 RepID=A0A5J4WYM9_9EUKA|nr:MAG: hypothetical protein EZS28_004884 [Streblomastix strix]